MSFVFDVKGVVDVEKDNFDGGCWFFYKMSWIIKVVEFYWVFVNCLLKFIVCCEEKLFN